MSGFGEAAAQFHEQNKDIEPNLLGGSNTKQDEGTLIVMGSGSEEAPSQGDEPQEGEPQSGEPQGGETQEAPQTFSLEDLRAQLGEDVPSLDNLKELYNSLKEKAKQYDEVMPKYKQYEEVLPKVKDPFADPIFKQMNTFAKNTGIKNPEIIGKFVGKTTEQLSENPIQLLALQRMISSPALSGVSMSEMQEAIAEEFGVSTDVSKIDMPVRMKIAVAEAAAALDSKINANEDADDVFSSAVKQQETLKQQYSQKLEAVKPYISNIAKSIGEVSRELGEHKVSLQVSDNVREAVSNEFTNYLMSQDVDLSNPNTVSSLKEAFAIRARQLMVDDLLEATVKAVKGVSTQKVLQEVHNGGEVVKQTKQVNTASAEESFKKQMLERWNRG